MTPAERRYWRNKRRRYEAWKAKNPDPPEGMMNDVDGFGTILPICEVQSDCMETMAYYSPNRPHWSKDPTYNLRRSR